ncbi:YhgE/Pip domain-containing protein [Bacillus sp. 03113]|uniref:YhgE/Pip domain-containing protein n=1 Tax=Bacillus sp. 03113 TaxID=2578211 RepID=UPI0011436BF0|nr:ABC transporter permease [Bacillus sp. 03113]
MKALKQFFKYPETFIGIVTAFMFMLIFFCVWMTAYDGVSDRVDNLKIGLVNEDKQMGPTIEKNLTKNLPFDVKTYESIKTAKEDMNQRELDMVMQIPENFSSQIQETGKTEINYFINQANSSMAKQIMDGAANNITQSINENVYAFKQQMILSNLSAQMNAAVPSKELAQNLSLNISQVLQSLNVNSVQSSIEKTNNTEGFASTMLPLLVVLASFVGSMIMSLNLNVASSKMKDQLNKWSVFLARQIINIGAAILLAVITLIFIAIFNFDLDTTLFQAWAFQTLVYFSFLSLTQMFVILFGPAGMVFNIISMALQLVTSGVIVPKAMLSSFYQTVGSYFPATYVADGYYTLIFGGEGLSNDMIPLLLVTAATLFVAVVRVVFQKNSVSESKELEACGKLTAQ